MHIITHSQVIVHCQAHSKVPSRLPGIVDTQSASHKIVCKPMWGSYGHLEYILTYTPNILSRILPSPLDGTLPARLVVCSKVSSQETCKYTPNNTLKYTSNHTWWYTPSLLCPICPCILPCGIIHPNSHDNMLSYILWHFQPRDLLSCRSKVLGGIRLVAYGREYLVGSRLQAACGRWKRVYVGRYHDVGHYSSPNLIVSAATAIWS